MPVFLLMRSGTSFHAPVDPRPSCEYTTVSFARANPVAQSKWRRWPPASRYPMAKVPRWRYRSGRSTRAPRR